LTSEREVLGSGCYEAGCRRARKKTIAWCFIIID
jgi:hypothetical protein